MFDKIQLNKDEKSKDKETHKKNNKSCSFQTNDLLKKLFV